MNRVERTLSGSSLPIRLVTIAAVAALALCFARVGVASQRIAVNASGVSLSVNANGDAVVAYSDEHGRQRHVLAWGGVDAAASGRPQPVLLLDYSGGNRRYDRSSWQRFNPTCDPYRGPALVYLIEGCTAPDGSHWALQAWRRTQPLRGVPPFRPQDTDVELRISHWTRTLASLDVYPNWTYRGTLQGLFGRLTYAGAPVFGTRTPSTSRNDPQARYVYIDTFDSPYGPGWKREGAKVTHAPTGGFCYSFAPIPPPTGYPKAMPTVPGVGKRHRVTVVGPGLTPDVQWTGLPLGAYDPAKDAVFNGIFDDLLANDRSCSSER